MVRIDDRDRTGKILGTVAEGLLGPIHKSDSDSFLLRLLKFERHAGLGELAPLKGAVVHSGPASFEIGLVPLKFLLRLLLPTGAKKRLGQQVMHCRVQTIGIHSQSLLEHDNGLLPLLQSHSGFPQLKKRRRFAGINLPRVLQRFRRFLRVRETKIGRPFDKVSRC